MGSEWSAPSLERLHHYDGMGGTIGGAACCSKERSTAHSRRHSAVLSCCHLPLSRRISLKVSALRFTPSSEDEKGSLADRLWDNHPPTPARIMRLKQVGRLMPQPRVLAPINPT